MASKYMKKCSTLLITRNMQIKTTVRYYFTPVRTAIIKKVCDNKVGEVIEKREPLYTVDETINWYHYFEKMYGTYSKY
jgi:hypothetical protein